MKRKLPTTITSRHSLLRRYANEIAGHYGVPVYLCGSALRKREPRDWDVRLRLKDDDFFYRYGITAKQWIEEGQTGLWTGGRWRWAKDCVKNAKRMSMHTHRNIDFQIYPASFWRQFVGKPRFRLDSMAGALTK